MGRLMLRGSRDSEILVDSQFRCRPEAEKNIVGCKGRGGTNGLGLTLTREERNISSRVSCGKGGSGIEFDMEHCRRRYVKFPGSASCHAEMVLEDLYRYIIIPIDLDSLLDYYKICYVYPFTRP